MLAGYCAILTQVPIGADAVTLWQVDDLERYVDRRALLAGDDPPEPPYWAHLWSGARVLADAVPRGAGRDLELGCGLGLPGLAAARRGGARDLRRSCARPAGVRARERGGQAVSARSTLVVADVTAGAIVGRFDLVLLAEVLYDRAAFAALARAVADTWRPGGSRCWRTARASTPGHSTRSSRRSGWRSRRRRGGGGGRGDGGDRPLRHPVAGSAARPAPGHRPYFSILR